jgi:hypothetical protein
MFDRYRKVLLQFAGSFLGALAPAGLEHAEGGSRVRTY